MHRDHALVGRDGAGGLERLPLDVGGVARWMLAAAGGPQYPPARVIGRVPRHLDASEILLNMVTAG